MISLKINNKEYSVDKNSKLIDVIREKGIEVPSLCYLKEYEHFTSCMLCVVKDNNKNVLIPSCSIYVEKGMDITTESEEIYQARKDTIDMLLSEHVGDCEATCTRGCPAGMDIPQMIREIKTGDFEAAIKTVKKDIAIPAVLGRICPAPCENACIHRLKDDSVSICNLKRFVADKDLESDNPYQPELKTRIGKKAAVIGAGPAGLSASYYLQISGVDVDLFDKHSNPGGSLLYEVPEEKLDTEILKNETEQILLTGINFIPNSELGKNIDLVSLARKYDAVVIAIGTIENQQFEIEQNEKGINAAKGTYQTSIKNVFAIGNSIRSGRSAIRSSAHGKEVAKVIFSSFNDDEVKPIKKRFNSSIGKIFDGEIAEFTKGSSEAGKCNNVTKEKGFSDEEAILEAQRCFHCDCRKINTCKLRNYADEFNGDQKRYKLTERKSFEKVIHDEIVFESGKCIKCNLCVQITGESSEQLGLTMVKRGFDIKISVPFNKSMDEAMKELKNKVVKSCPTAAISFIKNSELNEN